MRISYLRSGSLLLSIKLTGFLVGLVSVILVAAYFGVGPERDAWAIATSILIIIGNLTGGPVSEAIVPVFTARRAVDSPEAWKFVSTVVAWMAIVLSVVVVVAWLAADLIVDLFAPGFDPQLHILTVHLLRLSLPSLVFTQIAVCLARVLYCYGSFGPPEAILLFGPMLSIISMVFFVGQLGIEVLAYALVLGSVLSLILMIISVLRVGGRFYSVSSLRSPGVRELAHLTWPLLFNNGTSQLVTYVNAAIGSLLVVGSLSALGYAFRVFSIPNSTFAIVLSTLIFPVIADRFAHNDLAGVSRGVTKAFRWLILITFPVMSILVVLSLPITRLLFERGAFDRNASLMTAKVLAAYGIGLWGYGMAVVAGRVYIAMRLTKAVAILSTIILTGNVLLSLVLARTAGAVGLALAGSLAQTIGGIIWLVHLKGIMKYRLGRDIMLLMLVSGIAALAMSVVMYVAVYVYLVVVGDNGALALMAELCISICAGLLMYLGVTWAFRTSEVFEVLARLRSQLLRFLLRLRRDGRSTPVSSSEKLSR